MMLAMVLLVNSSCTNDDYDNQDVNATTKKSIKIEPGNINERVNILVIDSLNVDFNYETLDKEGDFSIPKEGDPSIPKDK